MVRPSTLAAAACGVLLAACRGCAALQTVAASDASAVRWVGRTVTDGDGSVGFDFEGVFAEFAVANSTVVLAEIVDNCGGSTKVGGGSRWAVEITPKDTTAMPSLHRVATVYSSSYVTTYTLFSNAGAGCDPPCSLSNFSVRLTRLTESRVSGCGPNGNLTVRSFSTDGQFLPAPAAPGRRVIFVGDSISAGDLNSAAVPYTGLAGPSICANAAFNDDISVSAGGWTCNPVLGLSCDAHYIAWGGIRLGVPGQQGWGMTGLYPYTFGALGENAYLPWNGAQFVPDAIVINLGTNDRPQPPALWWQQAYVQFVTETVLGSFSGDGSSSTSSSTPAAEAAERGASTGTEGDSARSSATRALPQIPVFLLFGPMTDEYAPLVLNITSVLVSQGVKATALNTTLPHPLTGCYNHPSGADNWEIASTILMPALKGALGW